MTDKRVFRQLSFAPFYMFGIMMMAYAFMIDTPEELFAGLYRILVAPSNLISDYMEIGSIGSAFFNAGALLVFTVVGVQYTGARVTGAVAASMIMVAGFSFFGKNLVNTFPIPLGVWLYTRFHGTPFRSYIHVALFGTGLAPIVSEMIFGVGLPYAWGIPIGLLVGVFVGFILVPLSVQFLNFHQGYNLYNVGFTIGIIGMAFVGFTRMFAIEITPVRYVYTGDDYMVFMFLLVLFAGMVIYGLWTNQGMKGYQKLLQSSGRMVSDFLVEHTVPLVILNMGLLGLMGLLYVRLSGGVVNGPIVGGILTMVAFGAFGKHPRNVLPILLGVYVTSALNIYDPAGTESILVALFATTLAPIAGQFGFVAGFIVAALHDAMAMNIGFVHGGLNLYNNGLSGGFVAALAVPILDLITERFPKKDEE